MLWVLPWVLLWSSRGEGQLNIRARYEDELVNTALLRNHLRPDPAPEGKIIEAIIVDASPIILPGDFPLSTKIPWTILNKIHVRTRHYIIAQEMLFRVGDRYRTDLIEESGRILRQLFILSIARLTAVRGSAPDRVVILVTTKDQWSLRLNTEFTLDGARLDYLGFSFSEHNLAGRNKRLSLEFSLNPGRYLLGLSYQDPRIWSSRHSAFVTAAVLLSRQTSELEGGVVGFQIGRPLFSLRTRYAWQAELSFAQGKARRFIGGDLEQFCFNKALGGRPGRGLLCNGTGEPIRETVAYPIPSPPRDAVHVPERFAAGRTYLDEALPYVYAYQTINASLSGTLSLGLLNKFNLTAGFRVEAVDNRPSNEADGASPEARAAFASVLPRSEQAAGPYVRLAAFRANFIKLKNIETFALTEDFQLGHNLVVEAHYVNPAFGLPSHFFELSGRYAHRFYFGDNLLYLSLNGGFRVQSGVCRPELCPAGNSLLVNEEVGALIKNVSPRFGPLRLFVQGRVRFRYHDLDQVPLTLGLDNGLRGFTTRAFSSFRSYFVNSGGGLVVVNAELRTLALNLWTIHVGAVLFYDGGDTPPLHFEPTSLCPRPRPQWLPPIETGAVQRDPLSCDVTFLSGIRWHQNVGVGLRILIPQFNRGVLRLDLAFPMEIRGASYLPVFSAEFGQAF